MDGRRSPAERAPRPSASWNKAAYSPSAAGKFSIAASLHSSMSSVNCSNPCASSVTPRAPATVAASAARCRARRSRKDALEPSPRKGASALTTSRASASAACRSASRMRRIAGCACCSWAAARAPANARSRSSSEASGTARKTASSSARAAVSTCLRERPKRTADCARSARQDRGVNSIAASRMSLASAPAGLCRSVRPAKSSTSTPQRASSAETRRAIDGSGVMRAAVLPGVSSVSRIAIASAKPSSFSLSATTIVTP